MMSNISEVFKQLKGGSSIYYGWSSVMHTRIDIVLCNKPQLECRAVAEHILTYLTHLEGRLNRFDPHSDLSRINSLGALQYVDLDDQMWTIISSALSYGKRTNFFFDVTINTVKQSVAPISRIVLDSKKRNLIFTSKTVNIDMGGFAKGYGLEVMRDWLRECGWTDFMINFGNSSVCAEGNCPGGRGWNVGVENINTTGYNVLELSLLNKSLNTSGNTHQHSRHIISPLTATPLDSLQSVSIVTDNPLDGEVLSTAIFAAGKEHYSEFISNFSIRAIYGIRYDAMTYTVTIL